MLSISRVSSDMSHYYEREDYYSKDATFSHNKIFGDLSKNIGITKFNKEQFHNLLHGYSADGKQKLINFKQKNLDADMLQEKVIDLKRSLKKNGFDENQRKKIYSSIEQSLQIEGRLSSIHNQKTFKSVDFNAKKELLSIGFLNKKLAKNKKIFTNEFSKFVNFVSQTTHRPGWDLTLSAPKSVSIASLVLKDKSVVEAHEKAVEYTLSKVQDLTQTRVKISGKKISKRTQNMSSISFTHTTSRGNDPQLHTHNVILNATKDGDKLRYIHRDIYYENSKLIGVIYQNELARRLKKQGYTLTSDPKKGVFEIDGIPKSLKDSFSNRRKQVEKNILKIAYQSYIKDYLKEKNVPFEAKTKNYIERFYIKKGHPLGSEWKIREGELIDLGGKDSFNSIKNTLETHEINQKNARLGVLLDRVSKTHSDPKEVFQSWQNTIKDYKLDLKKTKNPSRVGDLDLKKVIDKLSKKQAVFSKKDLIQETLSQNLGNYSLEYISQKIENNPYINKLIKGYSTKENLRLEAKIIDLYKAGRHKKEFIYSKKIRENLISSLTNEQKTAVKNTLENDSQFVLWQGVAGSGKTTSLKPLKQILDRYWYSSAALGPDGRSADVLGKSLNMQSKTIHSYLKSKCRKDVLFVDESSKISTKLMHDLMEKASNDKTKVIFIGDKKQYQAVEAGSPFRKLSETFGSERLESFIRQRDNKELHDTVKEAYEGNISLEKISKNIFEKSTKKARLEQTIDLFFKTKDLTNSLVVTETNVDKDKLNMKIREKLIERGLLSQKKIVISSNIPNQNQSFDKKNIELREGDKIEWRKNSINMKNREIAYVETISKRSITLKKKDGTTFKINPKKENFLDHGWASTTYSSQGMTVNNVIALMDQKTSKQGYYVAVSRAEKSYAIVTDDKNRLQKEVNKDLIKLNAMDFVKNKEANIGLQIT